MVRVASTMLPLGTRAPDFSLSDTGGGVVALSDFDGAEALLVAFICNHCPFVKHIGGAFSEFAREYSERGVGIVAINANDVERYPADSPVEMAREREEMRYVFPYLFDETQEVARAYRAACTPDFYLFDRERRLVYRGEFDASRPGNDEPIDGAALRAAVDAVLAGREPNPDQRPAIGCNIKWKPGNEPEWFGTGGR